MRQKKRVGDKAGMVTGRKTKKTEQNRPIMAVSWTDKVTAIFLSLTFLVATVGAITAYRQLQTVYNDYQARTRPYLVIQELQFYEVSSDSIYLLIDVTNSGERPAINISIQGIQVCVISGNQCTQIYVTESSENNTILYPGRINTTRINVDKNVYHNISPTDKIMVNMEYGYGNRGDIDYKEYNYEASLRLRPNSNVWRIESETGN